MIFLIAFTVQSRRCVKNESQKLCRFYVDYIVSEKTALFYKSAMKNIFLSLEISRKKNSLQNCRDCATEKK